MKLKCLYAVQYSLCIYVIKIILDKFSAFIYGAKISSFALELAVFERTFAF